MNDRSPGNKPDPHALMAAWIASGDAEAWRIATRRSRAEVARQLRVSERTLFRWEKAVSAPDLGHWRRYHRYLESIQPKEAPCPPPRNQSSGDPTPAESPDAPSASSASH